MSVTPGQALRASILGKYELDEGEQVILEQAATLADNIAELEAVVQNEGIMQAARGNGMRVHVALVEARYQKMALNRLLSSLKVADDGKSYQP